MTLNDYLKAHSIRPSHFAASIGASASCITRYLRGERIPSGETLARIAVATDGDVQVTDFLSVRAQRRTSLPERMAP